MADQVDSREQTRALELKAAAIRQDVDLLLREADQRRHGIFRFRTHLRERPAALIAGIGLGVTGLGLVLLILRRYQQRQSLKLAMSVAAVLAQRGPGWLRAVK